MTCCHLGILTPVVFGLVVLAVSGPASAQAGDSARPVADSADVSTIDAIITATYDVISGPAEEERDWSRFYSLFAPGARLIPTGRDTTGKTVSFMLTPEQYRQRGEGFFAQPGGFFEQEIGRKVDRYGNIAQVFSAYASFRQGEEQPFMRGVNSFQLLYDGSRWSIVSIFWEPESEDNPIPRELLNLE